MKSPQTLSNKKFFDLHRLPSLKSTRSHKTFPIVLDWNNFLIRSDLLADIRREISFHLRQQKTKLRAVMWKVKKKD